MNSGAVKLKGNTCGFLGKLIAVVTLCLGLVPQQTFAATADAQFYQYLYSICTAQVAPPSWLPSYGSMCVNAFPLGPAVGVPLSSVSSNLGTTNASGGLSTRKIKNIRELEEEQKNKSEKGASADGGGWGFLLSPQYGKNTRTETDLENGYKSTLTGLLVGLDYRFSETFILGATAGQTKDDAKFFNDAGSLKTSNNVVTLYSTWVPSEGVAVDGYLGYGNINLDSIRQVAFGPVISGMSSGSTTGKQSMAGMSISYQKDYGRMNLSPFFNLDYIKSSFDGYSEHGSNTTVDLIALHYGDRSSTSFTSSLGARLGSTYTYSWGSLLPAVRLTTVHEFQNKAKQISNELVITPGTAMSVSTDTPDRNYLIVGLSTVAALDSSVQLFLDFEKRAQDRLLNSWTLSAGMLVGF